MDSGPARTLARAGRLPVAVLVASFAIVGGALAATGALTPQGCTSDAGDTAGCGLPTQQGLDGVTAVAVSADGKSAYGAAVGDDAIVRFDRNTTTGALTPQGCIADAGDAAGCGTTQQGLDGARGVAVSADGSSVYVASEVDDAIVRFDRNTTSGALSPQGCVADPPDAPVCGATQQGLDGPIGVAVSLDGKSVYVASQLDHAIARFDRNTTSGALTPQGCIEATGGVSCGTPTQAGLSGATGVAVSADGESVYVAAVTDDAIVRFDRNTTSGALTPQGCIADPPDTAGCGTTQQGLDGPFGVALSADGGSAYVASGLDSAIVRFDRNTTSGALSAQGCIADPPDTAGCGTTQQGLGGARRVGLSSDGGSAYVPSFEDDAIVRFDRNTTTGVLTPQGCIADTGDVAGCGTPQQGLNGAAAVALSADGKSLYVAAALDDAIVRFGREVFVAPLPPGGGGPATPLPPKKCKKKKKKGKQGAVAAKKCKKKKKKQR